MKIQMRQKSALRPSVLEQVAWGSLWDQAGSSLSEAGTHSPTAELSSRPTSTVTAPCLPNYLTTPIVSNRTSKTTSIQFVPAYLKGLLNKVAGKLEKQNSWNSCIPACETWSSCQRHRNLPRDRLMVKLTQHCGHRFLIFSLISCPIQRHKLSATRKASNGNTEWIYPPSQAKRNKRNI